jgi:hypothetical protein
LFLFFKKESAFFFEKKKQKTFDYLSAQCGARRALLSTSMARLRSCSRWLQATGAPAETVAQGAGPRGLLRVRYRAERNVIRQAPMPLPGSEYMGIRAGGMMITAPKSGWDCHA